MSDAARWLLHRAREAGHAGRLCGLDPDAGMLSRARRWTDIEWVLADAASAKWDREFDLAVMSSHAFQFLVTDDDLRASLAAVRAALVDGGCLRSRRGNPSCGNGAVIPSNSFTRSILPALRCSRYDIEGLVGMSFELARHSPARPGTSHMWSGRACGFLDVSSLARFWSERIAVEEQFGNWDRQPVTDTSREIITSRPLRSFAVVNGVLLYRCGSGSRQCDIAATRLRQCDIRGKYSSHSAMILGVCMTVRYVMIGALADAGSRL